MPVLTLKRIAFVRTICYLYILGVVVFWVQDNYAAGYTNWVVISVGLVILLCLLLFVRNGIADIVVGMVLTLPSFYMVMAVTSDFTNHLNGSKPIINPWLYFGFGYAMFGIATLAAFLISLTYYFRSRLPIIDDVQ
jgi:hypothetical protein